MCNQVFAVTKITGDYMYVSNACLIARQLLFPPSSILLLSAHHPRSTISDPYPAYDWSEIYPITTCVLICNYHQCYLIP